MAFNFPASPSNGDTYTANGFTYEWDGCLLYTSDAADE